jgi:hypothetical protein
MTPEQVERARVLLRRAAARLGADAVGSGVDLLLDNMLDVGGVDEARELAALAFDAQAGRDEEREWLNRDNARFYRQPKGGV